MQLPLRDYWRRAWELNGSADSKSVSSPDCISMLDLYSFVRGLCASVELPPHCGSLCIFFSWFTLLVCMQSVNVRLDSLYLWGQKGLRSHLFIADGRKIKSLSLHSCFLVLIAYGKWQVIQQLVIYTLTWTKC